MSVLHLAQALSSPHGPCGEDLIFSREFDLIQEARRFDDPSISQGEWVTDIKEADWPAVIRISEDVLSRLSKDLRVVAWMAEARCKLHGFSGLAESYALLRQLCEAYWDEVHPVPEEGDLEQRAGVLDWLTKQTASLIREVALTRSVKGRFSLLDIDLARNQAMQLERNPALAAEVSPVRGMDAIEAAIKDTPRAFFDAALRESESLKAELEALRTLLDQRMGEYAPSFRASMEAIDDTQRFLQRHASPALTATLAGGVPDQYEQIEPMFCEPGRQEPSMGEKLEVAGGPIRSREHAIRQLRDIAEFFRRTEPHSPVAYLAEKAAHWGEMPLHEWLRSVVKDDGALSRVQELLGVSPEASE